MSRYVGLCKKIMQSMFEGVCKRGRSKKQWLDNISDYTIMDIIYLIPVIHDRYGWRKYVAKSSVLIKPPYYFLVMVLKVKVSIAY